MTQASAASAVQLEGVSVEREGRRVIEDVTLRIEAGAFVGIVGPNGAGKTTLLKAMLGLIPVSAGSITVFGRPRGRRSRGTPGVGYVPQRHAIAPAFPASVADVVAMGRRRGAAPLRLVRRVADPEVTRSLELVGIAGLAMRPVGRLSGGEQRRVMLAQALCAGARLLILDEPTIGLDLPAEQEFYALLKRLQTELSLTVIAVSHDLVALAGAASELVCINRRMHVHGNPEDVVHSHAMREAYSCEFDFLAGEIAHHSRSGRPL